MLFCEAAPPLVATWAASMAFAWFESARVEMSGFRQALDAGPVRSRVLGLDLAPESRWIAGCAYRQSSSDTQAVHGADLSFSSAEHSVGIVRFLHPRRPPWTLGLSGIPERVTAADLKDFGVPLIHASDEDHAGFSRRREMIPGSSKGRWRLGRVADPLPSDDRW